MRYFSTSIYTFLSIAFLTGCSTVSKTVSSDLEDPTITLGSANALTTDTNSLGIKATKDGKIEYNSIDGLIARIATSLKAWKMNYLIAYLVDKMETF